MVERLPGAFPAARQRPIPRDEETTMRPARIAVRLSLFALALAVAAPAFSQGSPPAANPPAAGLTSITGPIKGAPTGRTFVVARKSGTTTVDASKAKIRINGKFASFDAVKAGVMATVKGKMQGTTLIATDVDLSPRAPRKPANPAAPGRP
jgi:hypothetical protein